MFIMAANPCSDLTEIWQLVGWVLWVFKIVIPIIIIIFGMIDLGKAVVASKDDEIKKSIKALAMRAVAGVVIFFVPTLVGLIFRMVNGFADVEGEYNVCAVCVTHPNYCNTAAEAQCRAKGGKIEASGNCSVK